MRLLQPSILIGVLGVLMAGPLQAGDLVLTTTDNHDGTLTIGIDSFTENPPVGIALMLDPNGQQILSLERGLPYYDIITTFNPNSQQITAFAALATLGANDTFPDQIQNLITLDFGGPASGILTEDLLRGGIVDTQGQPLISNLPLAFTVTLDCFPNDASHAQQYTDWVTMGKPACWCGPYHCDGDANNAIQGFGEIRIGTVDLDILTANWQTTGATIVDACADIDHKPQGFDDLRVGTADLNILVANWQKTESQLPRNCPRAD